jgi:hypothetical protein
MQVLGENENVVIGLQDDPEPVHESCHNPTRQKAIPDA